ncbi:Alpha/Beta hydrolase protein [Schizophyllum commune]
MLSLLAAFALPLLVTAGPAPARRETTKLSQDEIDGFTPFAQYALSAYCHDGIDTWACGASCEANSDFELSVTGGDGSEVQYCNLSAPSLTNDVDYIGFSPSLNSIIVAHEGTDPTKLCADLTDVNLVQDSVNATLFPNIDSAAQVHTGFRDVHAATADAVLAAVRDLLSSKDTKTITTVGHSLGGALAELDSVFLKLNNPDATVNVVTFGKPRVGNEAWAEVVDSTVDSFKRVDNKHDLIPILPGRGLGSAHPEGEIHIVDEATWVKCPGNDDADDEDCTIKTVPNVFDGDIGDHLGPYNGVTLSTLNC